MLLENMKTDISCNRFGGNGDVIIEHYIDEKMLNDTVVMPPLFSRATGQMDMVSCHLAIAAGHLASAGNLADTPCRFEPVFPGELFPAAGEPGLHRIFFQIQYLCDFPDLKSFYIIQD